MTEIEVLQQISYTITGIFVIVSIAAGVYVGHVLGSKR